MTLTGVDVSRWQTSSPAFSNYEFMFARATYGLKVDSMFATHIANAKKAKIITGAYHFLYGSSVGSPEAQAALFATTALARDADIWALDWEPSQAPATKAEAKRFVAAIHKFGYKVGLYASRSGFPFDLGQDFDWIADWDATVFPAHAEFWQYRGSPLDVDKFNGTYEDLRALAAIPPAEDNVQTTITLTKFDAPRVFKTKAGLASLRRFTATGEIAPITDLPYSASADAAAEIVQSDNRVPHGAGFLRISSGGSAGYFILAGQVDLAAAPIPVDPTPYSQADLDAAVNADRARARIVYS